MKRKSWNTEMEKKKKPESAIETKGEEDDDIDADFEHFTHL